MKELDDLRAIEQRLIDHICQLEGQPAIAEALQEDVDELRGWREKKEG